MHGSKLAIIIIIADYNFFCSCLVISVMLCECHSTVHVVVTSMHLSTDHAKIPIFVVIYFLVHYNYMISRTDNKLLLYGDYLRT